MYCGLVVAVKPISMTMDKGYPSNSVWTDSVEVKYEGEVIFFDKKLYDYGVDQKTNSGSTVLLAIEFSDNPNHDRPKDCQFSSIGWVEINPKSYPQLGEEPSNSIFLNMRLSLKKTDFQDFLVFGNNLIRIEPTFNWGEDNKFLTYKSGQLIQFDISRINVELAPLEE